MAPGPRLVLMTAPAWPCPEVGPSPYPQPWLTPLWEECCWAIPRKDWNGVFPPKETGGNP